MSPLEGNGKAAGNAQAAFLFGSPVAKGPDRAEAPGQAPGFAEAALAGGGSSTFVTSAWNQSFSSS